MPPSRSNAASAKRTGGRRAGFAIALSAALTGCGTASTASGIHTPAPSAAPTPAPSGPPTPGCVASPPDVLPSANSVPPAKDDRFPSDLQTLAYTRFYETHAGVLAQPEVSSDGHVYFGFTRDAAQNLAALRSTEADPERIRAYCTPHSYNDVSLITAQVITGIDQALGIGVMVVAREPYDDRVDVGLRQLTPKTVAWIRSRYGALVGRVYYTQQCDAC